MVCLILTSGRAQAASASLRTPKPKAKLVSTPVAGLSETPERTRKRHTVVPNQGIEPSLSPESARDAAAARDDVCEPPKLVGGKNGEKKVKPTEAAAYAECKASSESQNEDTSGGGVAPMALLQSPDLDGCVNRILVGTYNGGAVPGHVINARLFHHRAHTSGGGLWTGDDQRDEDGDGLTRELESDLGTCDSYTLETGIGLGWTGGTCAAVRSLVNGVATSSDYNRTCNGNSADDPECWTPRDSDNDGLEDAWELWATPLSCTQVPSLPTNDAGTCTPIDLLATASCPGAWCVAEATATMTKPDPRVHDIYIQIDTLGCDATSASCAAAHSGDPTRAHLLTSDQLDWFTQFWTTSPSTCWDGSTGVCPHTNDRRYRIAAHVLPQHTFRIADDASGDEIEPGVNQANTFFNRFFGGVMRYGGLAHYVFGTHSSGGGQTRGNSRVTVSASFVSGNAVEDQNRLVDPLFHEVGHQLNLEHSHTNGTCASGCGTVRTDLQACDAPPTAPPPPPIPCAAVGSHNPNHPSLMSYSYQVSAGMRPKSAVPPASTDTDWAGCERRYSRFSKGLNRPLDESALNETLSTIWYNRKRAQDLFCYDGWNDGLQVSPYGYRLGTTICTTTSYGGPYCDANGCYVNWDSNNATTPDPAPATYGFDLDRDGANNMACSNDVLLDRDEWGTAFAWGKVRRRIDMAQTMFRIYGETFNGGVSGNHAGWDLNPTVGTPINADVNYPRSGCYVDADCGGAGCAFDTCTSASECVVPGLGCSTDNRCGCTSDSHCRSGACLANGRCATGWGTCPCFLGMCTGAGGGGCTGTGLCAGFGTSGTANDPPGPGAPPEESATFNGSSQRIELAYSGATHPFNGIDQRGSFGFSVEFRFDGFTGSEARRVIFSNGHAELRVVNSAGGPQLEAVMGAQSVITPAASPLLPGLWYRAHFMAHEGDTVLGLVLQPWDVLIGGYGVGTCVRRNNFNQPVTLNSTAWLGHDGSADTSRYFVGRMDNIQLSNFWLTMQDYVLPTPCAVQP